MLKKYIGFVYIGLALLTVGISSMDRNPNNQAWEFAPNMYVSVGYEPMSQVSKNNINPLGMNMREPVQGTVARKVGYKATDSSATDLMLYDMIPDSIGYSEKILSNPIITTEASLKQGGVLYARFCQHCHGEAGKGDGLVGKMYKGVPVYSSDALKTMNDGHIYHVITYGKGRMWGHGSQISQIDRWKIVQYVHKLQVEP